MMLSLTLSLLTLVLLSMSFKDDLKGREPVIYLRVSTKAQRSTLKAQRKTCEDWLKQQGITRKVRVYEEIIPGTAEDPPELLNAVGYCASKPGKCFLLVRDYQRISRNWRFGGMNLVPLFNADIPVVSVLRNQVSGTAKTTREGDWLIGLLMAIGAQESDQIKARTEAGTIVAQRRAFSAALRRNCSPRRTSTHTGNWCACWPLEWVKTRVPAGWAVQPRGGESEGCFWPMSGSVAATIWLSSG